MSANPGVPSSGASVAVAATSPQITGGAKVAAVLLAVAPWLAAVSVGVQTLLLAAALEAPPLQRMAHWCLVATALMCAFVISRHLWRGVHDGRMAPVRLLLWSTLPVWLPAEAVGQFLAQSLLRAGNPWGYAEASLLRITGQYLAWGLTGSVVFGLAIAAFLWRAPARRLPGIAWAWASLAPLTLFVGWVVGTAQVESPELLASLVGYAWVSLPFVLGFAGAALGDNPRAHARPDWILGVGLGALLVYVAAAAMAMAYALITAQTLQSVYGDAAMASDDVISRGARVAWLGLPLAALPLIGFVVRLRRWPAAPAWGIAVLPFALVVVAILIDATGPGAEHGLAAAYPRRLWLLVAYAVVAPLAIFAWRRKFGGSDVLRDGLALAAALAGLMWLAWRPGLLVLAPLTPQETRLERYTSAPPEDLAALRPHSPPPPPPATGTVQHVVVPVGEGEEPIEGTATGGEMGGVPGGVSGGLATKPPPNPLPATPLVVDPGALLVLRTAGADVRPPPTLYADKPRTTVTVVLHVSVGGSVTRVELLRSSGTEKLDANVRSTLETWRFRPWMEQGRVIPVRTVLTFIFVSQP